MGKVKFSGYTRRNKTEKKGIPLLIAYNLSLKNIGRIINQNLNIITKILLQNLYINELRSYFVREKLYPLERIVGSIQCKGKRCHTCHNVKETEIFTSTTTGKIFKINHKLNCNDKCLVYILTSK